MSHPAIFLLVPVFAIFLVTVPAYALEQNGVIEMPFTETPPIIDGKWTSVTEWQDASKTALQKNDDTAYVLTKHDRDSVYVMVDYITKQDGITYVKDRENAFGYDRRSSSSWTGGITVCFDTNDNGGNSFDSNDVCASNGFVGMQGSSAYFPEIMMHKAEFKDGIIAGLVFKKPNGFDGMIADSSTNDPFEGGRDHVTMELKIPISFLHKQDEYGFYVLIWNLKTDSNQYLVWPDSAPVSGNLVDYPSYWGSIKSPENKITAPPIPVLSISQKPIDFGNVAVSEKSSPKTITISNVGTAILQITGIRASGDFSIKSQPLMVLPNSDMSFDVVFAPLTVGEKSGVITISSNDLSHPTMTIDVKGVGTEKGKGCLIATAAYGSELAPQVQMLREIRDNVLFSTSSGAGFMTSFNALYYSFSPTVADWERQSPVFKEAVKITITPMLSTLSILNHVDIDSDQEMLGYGIGIILLNVGMYFIVPAIIIVKIRKKILSEIHHR